MPTPASFCLFSFLSNTKFYGKNLQCLNENMADINAFEWIQSMIINLNILKMEINEIEMKPHFNFFFFFSSPLQGKR